MAAPDVHQGTGEKWRGKNEALKLSRRRQTFKEESEKFERGRPPGKEG